MATSNGPHHHHPPNTDADYEGPEHAMRDQAMLRGGRGIGYSGGHGHHGSHENHHHHGSSAHYQPEENYPSPNEHSEADHEDDRYHRAPVYENSYHNDRDEEGDELENQQVNYGGRPGVSDGSGSDAPAYDNYDHPHHLHHPGSSQQHEGQDGEESRMRPMGHYIPVANVPLHSFV